MPKHINTEERWCSIVSKHKRNKGFHVPAEMVESGAKMVNGEDFVDKMVGSYYASSLELGCNTVPQYANAGDLVAPCEERLKEIFKPKYPYGVFGAVIHDDDQSQYRVEVGRCLYELTTVEEIEKVADSISSAAKAQAWPEVTNLTYTTVSGNKISYEEAMRLQASFKEHNSAVQKQIDALIADSGYAPEYIGGRKVQKEYPDELMQKIAALAKTKKSVTGFNLKLQFTGKHTIAKNGNYLKSSISEDELAALRKKLNYREKEAFIQGTVRVGTAVIPIQTVQQLKTVVNAFTRQSPGQVNGWPETVKKSKVRLVKNED